MKKIWIRFTNKDKELTFEIPFNEEEGSGSTIDRFKDKFFGNRKSDWCTNGHKYL